MQYSYTEAEFTITKGSWSGTYPLSELASWLAFYKRQRDVFPSAEQSYDVTIATLEKIAAETAR